MKDLRWSLLKSARLKRTRGAAFEEIIKSKLVYVVTGEEVFLKTLYPSRKYTKLYKRGELP